MSEPENEIVETSNVALWERLPEEDWKHFEWFCKWRDSIAKDRRITYFSRSIGSTPATVKKVMEKHKWQERFDAYKLQLHEEKQELDSIEREEMCKRHSFLSLKLQDKISEAIDNIDATDLTPKDIVTWLDVAVKVERLAKGQSTENVSQKKQVAVNVNIQNDKETLIKDPRSAELACQLLEDISLGIPAEESQYKKLLGTKNDGSIGNTQNTIDG